MDQHKLSVLDQIDSEIRMCNKKLMYLRSKETSHPSFIYSDLFDKLKKVKKLSCICDMNILFDICRICFGSSDMIELVDNSLGGTKEIRGQNPMSIKIKMPAYGKYMLQTECELDAYYEGTVSVGSKEPPACRNSSLSFAMPSRWENEFFVSSFDLVKLLCKTFLPDSEDKTTLLSLLETQYEDAELKQRKAEEAAGKKLEYDARILEHLFVSEVTKLAEFGPFVNAVNRLISSEKFDRKIYKQQSINLLRRALEASL